MLAYKPYIVLVQKEDWKKKSKMASVAHFTGVTATLTLMSTFYFYLFYTLPAKAKTVFPSWSRKTWQGFSTGGICRQRVKHMDSCSFYTEGLWPGQHWKLRINVVQLPPAIVQPAPLLPSALSSRASLSWKVVMQGKGIWGLSCLFSFPMVYFYCTSTKWAYGFMSSGPYFCGGVERRVLRVSKSLLTHLLIPAFPHGISPTFLVPRMP